MQPNKNNPITTVEKGKSHVIVELIEYISDAVVTRSILKKSTGLISAMSFADGEGLNEKISPFDTYAQIIDGTANLVIDGGLFVLNTGEGIIIPAHKSSYIKPNGPFKMLLTLIKSSYED